MKIVRTKPDAVAQGHPGAQHAAQHIGHGQRNRKVPPDMALENSSSAAAFGGQVQQLALAEALRKS